MISSAQSSSRGRGEKVLDRARVAWAAEKGLLNYRTLREERNRLQIDTLQRRHFGEWSDIFNSLEKCGGRVMICLLGKTVVGYQAFTPYSTRGNPFPEDMRVMRFTYVQIREDDVVQARGFGIASELIAKTLELAWSWDYEAVYTYTVAYELLEKAGFRSMGGKGIVREARHVRDFSPDQAPPLLFYIERK